MARRKKKKKETSKNIAVCIIAVSVIDLQMHYILSLLGKDPMESLAGVIVTEIVAVTLGYFIKAFSAKKEAEKIKLKRDLEGIPESED